MKGNDTKNCVYNETTNIKNVDMIDTSSVFHSNCSTLNCSKQDFPIDDLTVSTFKKNDNNQCKKFFIILVIGKKTKKTIIKIPKVIIEEQPSSPNSIESQLKKVTDNIYILYI